MDALGVQVGHYPAYGLREIGRAGFSCVKFVLMEDRTDWTVAGYVDACHAEGLQAWGIVARESLGALTFEAAARHYARVGSKLDYLTVGNENDGVPAENPMSWCIGIDECARLLTTFRTAFTGTTKLCAIGTVRGDGEYVKRLLARYPTALGGYFAFDCHAYAQWPNTVAGMLANYQTGLPLVVGEYGWPHPDPAQRGGYVRDMTEAFERLGVQAAAVYCWAREQGEGFWIDDPAALPAIRSLGYGPVQSQPAPVFVLGFKAAHDADPALVGEALEPESGPFPGLSVQKTTRGELYAAHTVEMGGWGIGFIDNARRRWRFAGGRWEAT